MEVNSYNDLAPRLIASTRREVKQRSLSKDERMVVAGEILSVTSHVSGFNETLAKGGKKIIEPIFLNRDQTPNPLGKGFDESELKAILSFSSSVLGLVCNTLAVTGGVNMYKKHPNLGLALAGYGMTSHAISCIEPWQAALKSTSGIERAAAHGHDFANSALQLHELTGISLKTVAVVDAVAWTALIPLVLLTWYISNRAQESNVISDFAAFREWLIKAQSDPKKFNELKEKYPGTLETEEDIDRFTLFLIENIPKSQLTDIKNEMIGSIKSAKPLTRKEKVLSSLSLAGSLGYIAMRIAAIATQLFLHATPLVAALLKFATPIFAAVSLISDIHSTIQAVNNPNLPKKVKMLCVAKLVCNVVGAAVIVASLFVPGINLIAISAYIVCLVASLALSCAKNHYLQRHIEIQQAVEPENFKFMIKWCKKREHESNKAQYTGLSRWQKRIEEAKSQGLLTPQQLAQFNSLPKPPSFFEELKQKLCQRKTKPIQARPLLC